MGPKLRNMSLSSKTSSSSYTKQLQSNGTERKSCTRYVQYIRANERAMLGILTMARQPAPTLLCIAEINALAVHWEMVWVSHHQRGLCCSLDIWMVWDGRWGEGDGGDGH